MLMREFSHQVCWTRDAPKGSRTVALKHLHIGLKEEKVTVALNSKATFTQQANATQCTTYVLFHSLAGSSGIYLKFVRQKAGCERGRRHETKVIGPR